MSEDTAFRLYRRAQKFLALPIDEAIDPRDYGEDEASEAELLIAELACALSDVESAARLQAYERCAKVAEGFAADLADGLGDPETALEIAAAIRALPEWE